MSMTLPDTKNVKQPFLLRHLDVFWLAIAVCLCAVTMMQTFPLRDKWPGLPPAPSVHESVVYGMGDIQLSYRRIGMMLQNAGDTGGRMTSIGDYDYKTLKDWLWLSEKLDGRANYVPSLAAFYFGAAPEAEQLSELVDYLVHMGTTPGLGERWRWLAHAVYLTRFKIKDQDRALGYAYQLANLDVEDLPEWARSMPAYVMAEVGEKKAARDLLLTLMATNRQMDQADINQTCWYIESRLREANDGLDQDEGYQYLCAEMIKAVKEEAAAQKP